MERSKYITRPCCQNERQNHNTATADKSFENDAKLKITFLKKLRADQFQGTLITL
jgi:hypothetical protein